jgi:hypothetical protein
MTVTAMAALVSQSSQGVFRNLGLRGPNVIVLEGDEDLLVVYTLAGGAVSFIAVVSSRTNLGLLKMEMRRVGEKIEQALGIGPGAKAILQDVFLMNESGLLIRHYSRDIHPEIDADILSGMLVAIQEFIRDALRSREGTLDQLQFGKYRIQFLRGRYTIAAAVLVGEGVDSALAPLREAMQDFEERYSSTLQNWDGSLDRFTDIDEIFEAILRASRASP